MEIIVNRQFFMVIFLIILSTIVDGANKRVLNVIRTRYNCPENFIFLHGKCYNTTNLNWIERKLTYVVILHVFIILRC